ncbi:MAG: hypothetical protein QFB87_02475 [Patescibacteria group bacterium]|nr:hypothetical protein [Patescibacteria group bacterium]
MKQVKINQAGVGHILAIGLIATSVVVGGTYVSVKKAQDSKAQASAASSKAAEAKGTLNSHRKTAHPLGTVDTPATTSESAKPTTTKPVSTPAPAKPAVTAPKTSVATTDQKAAPTPTPTPTPQPTATPLSVLTEVISNFETKGGPLNVTRDVVTVSGPISDAKARPIVFGFHDKLYYAYTQTQAPNFKTSPSDTAHSMAIISANVSSVAQVSAHLDKVSNLVDPNITAVGFSSGGN